MDSSNWFFDTFGWVFTLTPLGWIGLVVAIIAARIVVRFLWFILFPESFKAHKEKRRLAKAEKEGDIGHE